MMARTPIDSDVDRRIKELEAQLKEQELLANRAARPLLSQSILATLPIVLTVGLGFIANSIQSKWQHEDQLQVMREQGGLDRGKQAHDSAEAEKARKSEALRSFQLQKYDLEAKFEQQKREFEANADTEARHFSEGQLTLRSQHEAQQRQQSLEFTQNLERQKIQNEADLILQVIKVGDLKVARANINFLLNAGLVRDPDGRIAIAAKEPAVLPTVTGALQITVPDADSATGKILIQGLVQGSHGGGVQREKHIRDLIKAVGHERAKYGVRELAIVLAMIEVSTGGSYATTPEKCTRNWLIKRGISNVPAMVDTPSCFELEYGPATRLGKRLGNREQGDGYRFRGRGYFTITGREYYARAAAQWHTDYVANPDLMEQPADAFRSVLTVSGSALTNLRKREDYTAPPSEFSYVESVIPLIKAVTGDLNSPVNRVAARAREIEDLLRSLPDSPPVNE